MRTTAKWTIITSALIVALGFAIATSKSISPKFLRAQVTVKSGDIGIPGITKMYEAKLTNLGFLPAGVTRCEFMDDSISTGTMVAYAVQRWNESRIQWDTITEISESDFCKPYPLGIVSGKVVNGRLWPWQSLSTGEEATAARDGFRIGDLARFVIFVRTAGDYGSSVATAAFKIDEHPQAEANLRLKH